VLELPFDLPGVCRYHQALQARPGFQNS